MDCPAKILLTTLVLVAAPAPALAQTWPATVVAAGPRMVQTPAQPLIRIDGRVLRRPAPVPPTQTRLKLSTVEIDEIPDVDIRAKDEWLDDQGLRVSPTRVAFKRRF